MATINHKTYNEGTETFKDFSVYDGKDTLIFKVDGSSGNVGIGTSSPNYLLSSAGDAGLQGNENYLYFHSNYSIGNNSRARIRAVGAGGGSGYGGDLRIDTRAQNNTWNTDVVTVANTGSVGIGTSSPSVKTEISGSASGDFAALALTNTNQAGTADAATLSFKLGRSVDSFLFTIPAIKFVKEQQWTSTGSTVDGALTFSTIQNESTGERMRITSAGNVGIGTSSPTGRLTVYGEVDVLADPAGAGYGSRIGMPFNVSTYDLAFYTRSNTATFTERVRILSGGGLTFNGDTLQANALDDYEEGTFTPVLNFSGGTTGITYSQQLGRYTKIGNVVNFILVITLTNKGTSTGGANIGGLPFPIPNGAVNYGPFNIGAIINTSFNTFPSAIGIINTSYMVLEENVSGGTQSALTEADFANNSELRISGTYFV